MQSQLVEAFLSSQGNTCLWYANLIKSQGIEHLYAHILSIINEQFDKTRIELLSLNLRTRVKRISQYFRTWWTRKNRFDNSRG